MDRAQAPGSSKPYFDPPNMRDIMMKPMTAIPIMTPGMSIPSIFSSYFFYRPDTSVGASRV
jgi:hypothetical protein